MPNSEDSMQMSFETEFSPNATMNDLKNGIPGISYRESETMIV